MNILIYRKLKTRLIQHGLDIISPDDEKTCVVLNTSVFHYITPDKAGRLEDTILRFSEEVRKILGPED